MVPATAVECPFCGFPLTDGRLPGTPDFQRVVEEAFRSVPEGSRALFAQVFQLVFQNVQLQTALGGLNRSAQSDSLPELPRSVTRSWQEELPFLTDTELQRRAVQRRLDQIELDTRLEVERLEWKKRDLEAENRQLAVQVEQKRRQR
jgi:hypothetical protein